MSASPSPVDRLVAEVVGIGGPLASIVSHMQQSAARDGRTSEVHGILAALLTPPLSELCAEWPEQRVEDCTTALHAACERICDEIILVPPPNRAQRRLAAHRRPR